MITPDRPPALLTVTGAAELLKVSPRRVRAMIAAGQLPAERIGRDWIIRAVDLYPLYDRKNGRPRKEQKPAEELPPDAATVLAALTPERQSVSTIYRQLGWPRSKFEKVINTHHDALANAGAQLHVATKRDASGRLARYITVDGTRYSALSRPPRS